jgi:predicted CopG family antitoxin
MMQKEGRGGGKHIVVSDTNYEILNSLGSITSSFDSVITDLIKKANVNGKSMAGAALNPKEKEIQKEEK